MSYAKRRIFEEMENDRKYRCENCGKEKFNILLENTHLVSVCIECDERKIWN